MEIVPLDGLSQTRCLGMLIHLINFLRQSVTIIGELAPNQKTFTDNLGNPFKYYFKCILSVFKMKRSDWPHVPHCLFWLFVPFMVFPYMVKLYWVTHGANFSAALLLHCYSQVATIDVYFRVFSYTLVTEMLSLRSNGKTKFQQRLRLVGTST